MIRAISIVTDSTWDQTYCELAMYGYMMKDMPSANHVWGSFLREKGFIRKAAPEDLPDVYTVKDFCRDYPNGTYLLAILILRGIVNSPCNCFARYQVTFNGNIALPEGATVGPISVSLALDGEPIQTSRAIVTPAAADNYFNVTATAIITVPRGCCFNVSVENTSESATPATTPAPAINVQNANLTVSRIA